MRKGYKGVAKALWTCVMQVQRKFWSDSIHVANLQCGDDSILQGNVNVHWITLLRFAKTTKRFQ